MSLSRRWLWWAVLLAWAAVMCQQASAAAAPLAYRPSACQDRFCCGATLETRNCRYQGQRCRCPFVVRKPYARPYWGSHQSEDD
ncbi:uncharacterized protein [Penaeus vannamei]|uniref:uncharacterized protein isoform X2 n=1 Tax=Penaeus vannamei TaxID=6689 RepID=UPI00387F9270